MELTYRKSKDSDEAIIKELIALRFGNRDSCGVTNNLDGRYTLAFDGDTLVAMTGLNDSKFYNGLELDWTCIREEYEHNGIVYLMIKDLINTTENYTKDIYASCWKLGDNNIINLRHSMAKLHFTPVLYKRLMFNSKYNNCKDICVNYKEGCWCQEDLYLRKGGNKEAL